MKKLIGRLSGTDFSLWLFVTKTIAKTRAVQPQTEVCAKFVLIALLLVSVGATSCRKPNPADEKRFDLKGKVVAVERDKHLVTISHEAVKDFMPGMTMPFMLPDEATLGYLATGDDITATLVVDGGQSWLENVTITRQSTDPSATTGITEAKEGDEVPDYTMVNQDAKDIRLNNFRGKAVTLDLHLHALPSARVLQPDEHKFRRGRSAVAEGTRRLFQDALVEYHYRS
jgi:Cu/Ag efflux protein CusF